MTTSFIPACFNTVTTTPFCRVALLPRQDVLPSAELLACIGSDALLRSEGFQSHKRRCDFLWNRWLLARLLAQTDPNARLQEQPPYSPVVHASSPLFCSISHTGTLIAVALASHPVALDVECPKPGRAVEPIWMRILNRALWDNTPAERRHEAFYDYWGLYECAIKLKGTFRHSAREAFVELDGRRLAHRHARPRHDTTLTIVSDAITHMTIETIRAPL